MLNFLKRFTLFSFDLDKICKTEILVLIQILFFLCKYCTVKISSFSRSNSQNLKISVFAAAFQFQIYWIFEDYQKRNFTNM